MRRSSITVRLAVFAAVVFAVISTVAAVIGISLLAPSAPATAAVNKAGCARSRRAPCVVIRIDGTRPGFSAANRRAESFVTSR